MRIAILALLFLKALTAQQGAGQMAEMMRQMGEMKMTLKTNSISTTPISDDLLKVPEGYTIVK